MSARTTPVSDWPARRAQRVTTTRTGLVIGGAYVRPPRPQSADADRVQRALVARRDRSCTEARDALLHRLAFAGGVANALIGITSPSWIHVFVGIVVTAFAVTRR